MDDFRTNTKIPFKKSDSYLIIFLIIALLLVNAVLNLLFGQANKISTYNNFQIRKQSKCAAVENIKLVSNDYEIQ